MGPERENMMLFMNGKAIGTINDIQMTTIESDTEPSMAGINLSKNRDFTATLRARFPHITRKHFIRNMRKLGYSKTQAKQMAWDTQKKKLSYSYANFLYMFGGLPYLIR